MPPNDVLSTVPGQHQSFFSAGALSYTIAVTWWSVADLLIYPQGVPFPSLPDLFFVLQYPFYALAVICIPTGHYWGSRVKVLVDSLLLMGGAVAISWYFLLLPLFGISGISPLAKMVSLWYPLADLFLFFALSMILLRTIRYPADKPVVGILVAAVVCLILGDSGATWLLLHRSHVSQTGYLPDLFWAASDLLTALAALVQVRMVQRELSGRLPTAAPETAHEGLQSEDVKAGLRLFLPIVAALVASVALLLGAALRVGTGGVGGAQWPRLVAPFTVSVALLVLIIIRQWLIFVETVQLRRAAEAAGAREVALAELNRRKDEFLGVLSHEMRTPLTSVQGYIHLLIRRYTASRAPAAGPASPALSTATSASSSGELEQIRAILASCEQSLQRLIPSRVGML